MEWKINIKKVIYKLLLADPWKGQFVHFFAILYGENLHEYMEWTINIKKVIYKLLLADPWKGQFVHFFAILYGENLHEYMENVDSFLQFFNL